MPTIEDGNAKIFQAGVHQPHEAALGAHDDDSHGMLAHEPTFVTCHLCGKPQRLSTFYKSHLPACLLQWQEEERLLVAQLVNGDFDDCGLSDKHYVARKPPPPPTLPDHVATDALDDVQLAILNDAAARVWKVRACQHAHGILPKFVLLPPLPLPPDRGPVALPQLWPWNQSAQCLQAPQGVPPSPARDALWPACQHLSQPS